jgi:hypothetical protein
MEGIMNVKFAVNLDNNSTPDKTAFFLAVEKKAQPPLVHQQAGKEHQSGNGNKASRSAIVLFISWYVICALP